MSGGHGQTELEDLDGVSSSLLFIQGCMSIYCVLDSVLGIGGVAENKNLHSQCACFPTCLTSGVPRRRCREEERAVA